MDTCVLFRVDASRETGGGHLSRCLVLADCVASRGPVVHFVCAALDPSYEREIASRGYEINLIEGGLSPAGNLAGWLEADAQGCAALLAADRGMKRVLVVDHYSIDARWERLLRPFVDRIVIIDDLADRVHDCDVLVDQAYAEDGARYAKLIPGNCLGLFGSRYALLRPEFAQWREKRARRMRIPENGFVVHVFFGSEDRKGNTLRFTKLLLGVGNVREIRVAVSAHFADTAALEELRQRSGGCMVWQLVGTQMAEHMAGCDIAVGAPGHATWERACLGLPSAYVASAGNQRPILQRLERAGFCAYLGADEELADEAFLAGIARFLADRDALAAMQARSLSAVDGLGGHRVAEAILSLEIQR